MTDTITGKTPWGLDYSMDIEAGTVLDANGETWEILGPTGGDLSASDHEPYFYYSSRGEYRVRRAMTAAERRESDRSSAAYGAFMDAVEQEWKGLTDALRALGADASVWQTGGMCLAIGWKLDEGEAYAMLTGTDGPLAADRKDEGDHYELGVYLDEDQAGDGYEERFFPTIKIPPSDRSRDQEAAEAIVAAAAAAYEARKAEAATA